MKTTLVLVLFPLLLLSCGQDLAHIQFKGPGGNVLISNSKLNRTYNVSMFYSKVGTNNLTVQSSELLDHGYLAKPGYGIAVGTSGTTVFQNNLMGKTTSDSHTSCLTLFVGTGPVLLRDNTIVGSSIGSTPLVNFQGSSQANIQTEGNIYLP